jgi:hypothetical protein
MGNLTMDTLLVYKLQVCAQGLSQEAVHGRSDHGI